MTQQTRNSLNTVGQMLTVAFIVFLAMSIYYTNKYGRMANHLHCDHSVNKLGSVHETGNVYYAHGHRAGISNHK